MEQVKKERVRATINSVSSVQENAGWLYTHVTLEEEEYKGKIFVMYHKEQEELLKFQPPMRIEFELQSVREESIAAKLHQPVALGGIDKQLAIIAQTCLERAVNVYSLKGDIATEDLDNLLVTSDKFYNWVVSKSEGYGG